MGSDRERAKKLFIDYACNHFYMDRDGAGIEYDKYGISEAEEKKWRREYISFWVNQLSTDDLTAVDKLSDAKATEALPALIEMADKGDSYAKLRYANAIWCITTSGAYVRPKAEKAAIDLWQSLVQGAIEISENHKTDISRSSMKNLEASTPEEYVLDYAVRQLERVKKSNL